MMIGKNDVLDKLKEELSDVQIKILRAEYEMNADIELPLLEEEKEEWRNSQKAYAERVNKHILN